MGEIQKCRWELKILRKSPVFFLLKKIEDISKFREYSARESLLPPREGVIGYAPKVADLLFLARRNTMKKLFSMLAMLCMALFIAGCSEDAGKPAGDTTTPSTAPSTPETGTGAAPGAEGEGEKAPEGEGEKAPEGEGEKEAGSTPE
ncbi:MAG TPA: hypothetical protein VLA12_17180 [Planctomycetaceae bacterium]|nr:hypothetical protein [Planctomycetaceae bacterium]